MDTANAILIRYSARDLQSKAVPEEILIKILEASLHSPSSGSSQAWQVFVSGGETTE